YQPRHDARADIFERERGAMKELERIDPVLHRDERDRKVQCVGHNSRQGGLTDFTFCVRPEYTPADLNERTRGQRREFLAAPSFNRLRNVEPSVRCKAIKDRPFERRRRRLAACRYEPHGAVIRAPWGATDEM